MLVGVVYCKTPSKNQLYIGDPAIEGACKKLAVKVTFVAAPHKILSGPKLTPQTILQLNAPVPPVWF